MNEQAKGLLITALGVLLVVPDSLFVRLIDADAMTIAFWRLLNAGVVIGLGILLLQGTAPFRAVLGTGWNGLIYGVGTGASGVMFVQAVSLTSVANVVFIIASMPIFAAVFSRVFLGEPISRRMVWTIVAVVVGLGVIAYGSGQTHEASLAGDLLALAVSCFFAAGLTAARGLRRVSMVPALPLAYVSFALMISPFAAPLSIPPEQVSLVALHGAFIVAASSLLALGPRYITSAEVSLLVLGESVLAPILVWGMLGENPGGWALTGGALVLSALFLSNFVALRRRRRVASARPH